MAITFVTWGSPRQCGKGVARGARLTGTLPHGTPGAMWLTAEVIHTVCELFTESVDMSASEATPRGHRSERFGGPDRGTIIATVLAQRRFDGGVQPCRRTRNVSTASDRCARNRDSVGDRTGSTSNTPAAS